MCINFVEDEVNNDDEEMWKLNYYLMYLVEKNASWDNHWSDWFKINISNRCLFSDINHPKNGSQPWGNPTPIKSFCKPSIFTPKCSLLKNVQIHVVFCDEMRRDFFLLSDTLFDILTSPIINLSITLYVVTTWPTGSCNSSNKWF